MIPEKYDELKIGAKVQVKNKNGDTVKATVTRLSDDKVTIDANHPLAGESLVFEIELVEFVKTFS